MDFVLVRRGRPLLAVECKWSAEDFDPSALTAFSRRYPRAVCRVVARDADRAWSRRFDALEVRFVNLEGLVRELEGHAV